MWLIYILISRCVHAVVHINASINHYINIVLPLCLYIYMVVGYTHRYVVPTCLASWCSKPLCKPLHIHHKLMLLVNHNLQIDMHSVHCHHSHPSHLVYLGGESFTINVYNWFIECLCSYWQHQALSCYYIIHSFIELASITVTASGSHIVCF